QAFIDANKIFEQLPAEDKKLTQKNKNDFEHYLNNVRNRIAQLLDEVTLLSEKAASADDEESKNTLMQQADEKEQIAMYLILEEFEIIAQRNKQSFRKNSLIIEKLLSQNLSKQEKELMQAIFAQINNFMLDAENKRVKAVQDELSFNVKKMLLQDAFTLESSALDLQLEAIRMMREKDVESMLAYQPKKENTTSPPEIKNVLKSAEILLAKDEAPEAKIIPKSTEKPKENNTIAEQKQKEEKAASELLEAEPIKAALLATEEANKRREDSVNQAKLVLAQKQQVMENHPKENKDVPIQKAENLSTEIAKIANQEKEIEIETKTELTLAKKPNTSDSDTKKVSDLPQIFPQVKLEQVPTGTIFTVQIAAVGNLLSSQNFMNVIDLFTIKDKEKELYRYFSGKFESITGAIIRRNALRQQGYSDAFIKSWKAGENVSILEAAGPLDQATTELLNKTTITLPSKYRKINFAATSISQLSGVYYTVQVGVYSRPRSSTQLFGIKPLYHNRLNNGYWVYFNGIFKTIADAETNKDAIRTKGVADAFVVAFKEGEKVSVSDARKALQQGTKTPKDEDIVILEDVANAVDQELADVIGNIVTPTNVKRVYKVQIGVYSRPVSMEEIQNK
ncbi:MAG: hypothetical protein JW729_08025, partial [Bacteroidales bacterium]|nr:hypothetical protein [Bacteroidales bacterium]